MTRPTVLIEFADDVDSVDLAPVEWFEIKRRREGEPTATVKLDDPQSRYGGACRIRLTASVPGGETYTLFEGVALVEPSGFELAP